MTITMITGALPEPTTQLTFTSFVLRTANSVMRIASTTSATVRARSRLLRASPPPFCAAGFCSAVDIARRSYPSAAPDRALAPRAAIRFEHEAARTSRRRARAGGVGGGARGVRLAQQDGNVRLGAGAGALDGAG